MPSIIAHRGGFSYVERGCYCDYMAYLDILIVCKQVFDVDLYGLLNQG
jgi:hypothetical protein